MDDTTILETPRYRNFNAEVARGRNPNGPDVIATITCETVDADNEVVLADGADLSRFVKAPRIMLCHAYGRPGEYYPLPIGVALWTKQEGNALLAGIRFSRTTDMAKEVHGLFAEGMLNTFSIGFQSIEASKPTPQEKVAHPDWAAAVLVHRRWKLLEVSVVPIPSNEDAIGVYLRKGRKLPTFVHLPSHLKGMSMDSKGLNENGWISDDPTDITEGMHVRIHPGKGGGCGTVKSVHRSGLIPDVDGDQNATEEEPAARVETHDDGHKGTGNHVGIKCKHLNPVTDGIVPTPGKAMSEGDATSGGYTVSGQHDEEKDDGQMFEGEDHTGHYDEYEPKPGHYVKWDDHQGMHKGCGKCMSVHKSGKVPSVINDAFASEDEPHARVKVFKESAEPHVYTETDHHVAVKCAHMKRMDMLAGFQSAKEIFLYGDDDQVLKFVPAEKPTGTLAPARRAAPVKPAPPKTIPPFRTREQVVAGIERQVREKFDPESVAARATEQARDRMLGAI